MQAINNVYKANLKGMLKVMSAGGDSRVLMHGQDATMVDVGGKDRPPEDPPDKPESWARKVIGTGLGGMPIPEEILDDEFVKSRVTLKFPNGVDGEPVITIGQEVIDAMNGLWKQCMFVKVLGRKVSLAAVSHRLREMWKPSGAMYVLDLPRHFFMVRFEKEEEFLTALTGGPWRAFGSCLLVKAWSPEFNPLKDEIVTTPIWVRIADMPVSFYHKSILMSVAQGLGRPLKVDLTMLHFERGRFARVCVEVDLKRPLQGALLVNGDRYYVAYEGLTNICSKCGIYGHLVHNCPKELSEQAAAVVNQLRVSEVDVANTVPQGDGFIMVNKAGRREESGLRNSGVPAGGDRGVGGNQRRELYRRKGAENIALSNSCGRLADDLATKEVRKVANQSESNKENENIQPRAPREQSVEQGKAVVFGALLENRISGPYGGSKEKRPVNKKAGEANGSKPNHVRNNRPTRSLVFGPTKGDYEKLTNGKQIRVEKESFGRVTNGTRTVVDGGAATAMEVGVTALNEQECMGQGIVRSGSGVVAQERSPTVAESDLVGQKSRSPGPGVVTHERPPTSPNRVIMGMNLVLSGAGVITHERPPAEMDSHALELRSITLGSVVVTHERSPTTNTGSRSA